MREPYSIDVFRRNGALFVSPAVGSTLGLENLRGVIVVSDSADLVRALELARAQVDAAWARPRSERFVSGPNFWVAAGASSWSDFLHGTVEVSIRYGTKETRISVLVPDPAYKRLQATNATPRSTHPVDLPLADAAAVVVQLLDEVPSP